MWSSVYYERFLKDHLWGRMSIVDTKPFMLLCVWRRIVVHMPQGIDIPALPVDVADYRKPQCIQLCPEWLPVWFYNDGDGQAPV